MAYSMFEPPKLHITESMKLYCEQYDHPSPVPFRHKTISPNFNLQPSPNNYPKRSGNNTNEQKTHIHHSKKCPIYVHHFVNRNIPNVPSDNSRYNTPIKYKEQHKLNNSKHNKPDVSIEKLEESYWASWKPSKEQTHHSNKSKQFNKNNNDLEKGKLIQHIHNKTTYISTDTESSSQDLINFESEKSTSSLNELRTNSQEIQTEFDNSELKEIVEKATETEVLTNILKHTDSFILTAKKQQHDSKAKRFEQPKCIRLYKKPGYTSSNNYIKGGSYPLKSCLKKESMFSKGNIRLGPPGSSLIVTTSRYTRSYRK